MAATVKPAREAPRRIVLCAPRVEIRARWRELLDVAPAYSVIGECAGMAEAEAAAVVFAPDILVAAPDDGGADFLLGVKRLRLAARAMRIIAVVPADMCESSRLLAAGIDASIDIAATAAQFMHALARIDAGEMVLATRDGR